MKRNWKYDKQSTMDVLQLDNMVRCFVYCLLVVACCCCNAKREAKHIRTGATSDLEGLAQPANQTVMSEVKIISPAQQSITPVLNATGAIYYDPRLVNNISARFSGRIEKMYVRYNFENVTKGQRLMDIYSPEILTEQQNYIYLLKNSSNDIAKTHSSKEKLLLLGMTETQVYQIEKTMQPVNPLPLHSAYSGHIHDIGIAAGNAAPAVSGEMSSPMGTGRAMVSLAKNEILASSQTSALSINEGMYVQTGQPVFSVYNTAQVWAVLNIFPADAQYIKAGDSVAIIAETNPSNVIKATIDYLEPYTDQNGSAIKARVYLKNYENLHLKIGTLLTAQIESGGIKGIWLPRKAVVNLGKKQIVFLQSKNYFVTREIQTGFETDSLVQIVSGLSGDEHVAANAEYMVDSESFIETDSENNKK